MIIKLDNFLLERHIKEELNIGRLGRGIAIGGSLLAATSFMTGCQNRPNDINKTEISNTNSQIQLKYPCVVLFISNYCSKCRQYEPDFKEVEKECDKYNFNFYIFNISESNEYLNMYNNFKLRGLPTTLFIDKDENINKEVGYMSQDKLKSKINKFIFKEKKLKVPTYDEYSNEEL